MKKGFAIGLGIFATIGLLFGAIIFMFIRGYVNASKWSVHETMTMEEKDDYSNRALFPELADSLERLGKRGARDVEYMVETYQYDSLEEMYAALPSGCEVAIEYTLENANPTASEDITGTAVTRYEIEYVLPVRDKNTVPEEYEVYTYNAFHHYYVYEYEDGTYRFAANICTV